MNRNKRIIRASILGIVANVFLASFKAVVGFLAGSVAIVMDAVNNLSDVLSSVITIIWSYRILFGHSYQRHRIDGWCVVACGIREKDLPPYRP